MLVEYRLKPDGPLTFSIRGQTWKFGLRYRTSDPELIRYLQTRSAYFEVTEVEPLPPPESEPEPEPEPTKPKKAAPKRAKRTYVRRKPAKKRS